MILVTIGTNDKRFDRLLKTVEQAVKAGVIRDQVVVQAGFTAYESSCMEVHDYFDQETFDRMLDEADLVITHGGVGTIMTALKKGKVILAAARLQKYHEHVNDHQIQLLESFDEKGYLIYMRDLEQFSVYYERAKEFRPMPYVSNTANMIGYLENWIAGEQAKKTGRSE